MTTQLKRDRVAQAGGTHMSIRRDRVAGRPCDCSIEVR
jgi:hypothetical protein